MRDGQLFVYLNKPVSGIFSGLFQDVNAGKAGSGSTGSRSARPRRWQRYLRWPCAPAQKKGPPEMAAQNN
jgi:hypothetical protein